MTYTQHRSQARHQEAIGTVTAGRVSEQGRSTDTDVWRPLVDRAVALPKATALKAAGV